MVTKVPFKSPVISRGDFADWLLMMYFAGEIHESIQQAALETLAEFSRKHEW
ncbi:hypothetical protein PS2_025 [Serratia phage PS2]|uniref:Uncharacterized protein n=1 Tax=Serratia phage PS2 TaxID=1481112 RepID=A0A023W629_9CAUD|nr:hypothetical protein FF83_gp025 [Serratia phage PS2]AHY25276.1 hypothetical protein PS2_025 [Serratia phage PS2]